MLRGFLELSALEKDAAHPVMRFPKVGLPIEGQLELRLGFFHAPLLEERQAESRVRFRIRRRTGVRLALEDGLAIENGRLFIVPLTEAHVADSVIGLVEIVLIGDRFLEVLARVLQPSFLDRLVPESNGIILVAIVLGSRPGRHERKEEQRREQKNAPAEADGAHVPRRPEIRKQKRHESNLQVRWPYPGPPITVRARRISLATSRAATNRSESTRRWPRGLNRKSTKLASFGAPPIKQAT